MATSESITGTIGDVTIGGVQSKGQLTTWGRYSYTYPPTQHDGNGRAQGAIHRKATVTDDKGEGRRVGGLGVENVMVSRVEHMAEGDHGTMTRTIVQSIAARRQQTKLMQRAQHDSGSDDGRLDEDNESMRQISVEETSSDLSSADDTMLSSTGQESTTGSNLSIGTYWRQARIQETGSTTTDEWELVPGQSHDLAQDSHNEMQASESAHVA